MVLEGRSGGGGGVSGLQDIYIENKSLFSNSYWECEKAPMHYFPVDSLNIINGEKMGFGSLWSL